MTLSVVSDQEHEETRCDHVGEDGVRCGVTGSLVREDGRCWSHSEDPEVVSERSQARRQGGLRTAAKASRGLDPDDLPPLDGPHAAAEWCAIIGRAVTSGRLSSAQAQAGMRSVSEFLRAHEASALKDEMDELRAELRGRRKGAR